MVLSDDFINIKFQDEIRAKKPVGIYWLQSFAAKTFGVEEISSYRILLFKCFITIIFLTLITRLIFSFEQSLLITLFFASSFIFISEAHLAKTDSTLLSLICIQQFLLLKIILAKTKSFKTEYLYPSFLWLSFAFGVLVKGPVSLAILFSTIVSFCLFQKSFSLFKSIKPILGILICSVVIIPWFLAIQDATNGFFFKKHSLKIFLVNYKVVKKVMEHGQERIYYYFLLPCGQLHLFCQAQFYFVLKIKIT